MSDKELIQAIINGNRNSYTLFYERFQSIVFRTAYGYFPNNADAEEITQDVFIKVFRSAHQFKHNSSISTWLYTITVNKCRDKLRFKNSLKRFSFFSAFLLDENEELRNSIPDLSHHGIEADKKEDDSIIYKAIEKLSGNQKTAFILTQLENLSGREAAEIMNTTSKSVESLIQRAKVNLRKELGKIYNDRRK